MMSSVPHPPVVSREEWLSARVRLLEEEKEQTRRYDRLNAQRRRLPMVRLDKEYRFETPDGTKTLAELFEGRRQLVVYHFMFDPEWEEGCQGCTGYVNALGDLSLLSVRDTTFSLISRAPLAKLLRYRQEKGWTCNWASSHGSDFNYDFHVTNDPTVAPMEYNYRTAEEWAERGSPMHGGEAHGISVFFQVDGQVFHTYSVFGRGMENMTNSFSLLDITPYGRQEDFEDSPEGWPQHPTYG